VPAVRAVPTGSADRADLLLGDPRGSRKPLHDATLLIGHQEQWVSDAAVRLRLRQLGGHRLNLTGVVRTADVLAEEDHPADQSGPDGVEERWRGREPGIGPDHALPGLLGGGKPERLRTHRRARRTGRPGGQRPDRLHEPGADK